MSPLSFGKFCIVGVKVAPELRELPISLFQVGRKRDAGLFLLRFRDRHTFSL